MSSISIVCPSCHCGDLETPEQLCDHVSTIHDSPAPIHEQLFDNSIQLQSWLSEVEDSRTEGGYVGSEEGPSSDDKEYYLLCRRRVSPMLKRRRLSDSARFSEAEGSIVSCTAFVHVMERIDGSVYVRFCLEHAGHTPSDQLRQSPPASRSRRRRQSHLQTNESTGSKDGEMICGSVFEDNNNVNTVRKVDLGPDVEFDTSSMNSQISQRLDTTTDRLRVLTQVLADLAVDIHAFEDRQCAIAI
ncbi:hypothetical protein NECAME_07176 [Necator americanus]|uniref:C2H2-type domain-containing protein n=1 Tax=Necator americanus TaxID=51031 RepID=W2TPX1_NECAM|nr:hypothetical protein NECAME_07176 [Necator americanus]ETN83813.1 hypothetical protein NECAME_07176 [Necator americanus]